MIAFLSIIGLVFGLTYLGITVTLKNKIESIFSQAWGAKVEIGYLDIGLFPIRVGLYDLALTDPDKPMENLVEVSHIGASLSFYHLVVGRTVIEEIAIKDLKFNQPREHSGALPEKIASEQSIIEDSAFKIPAAIIPNLEDVLARENLQTLIMAKSVKYKLNNLADDWNSSQKDLPTKQQFADYKLRFNDLINGSFASLDEIQQKQKEFEQLQKEVKDKIKAVENSKNLLVNNLLKLQKEVLSLKDLPAQDLARLQQKYSLDASGLSNVTYLLYGDKIQSYMNIAQDWYQKAKPFITKWQANRVEKEQEKQQQQDKRLLGTQVVFKEFDPQPDFIIKRIILSSTIPWGELKLKVLDVNLDQPVSKRPITFFAELQPAGQTAMMKIVGESNFIKAGKGFHAANLIMSNYQIKNWALSNDEQIPVLMKKALNQIEGKFLLDENEKITAKITLNYQQVQFDLSQTKSKDVKRYIAPIFENINRFSVEANIKGKLFAPRIGVTSDLDKKLSKAFNKVLNREIKLAKKQMQVEFDKCVKNELEPINLQLSELLNEKVNLEINAASMHKILAKDADQYFAEQKQKLVDQANAKLNAEKERLKKEAKQKADAQKQRLADEVNKRAKEQQKKLEKELMKQFKF